jgi:hypothetical protein
VQTRRKLTLKQKLQIALILAIAVAGLRTAYILYERHTASVEEASRQPPPLNPDYYVTPRRLHPYDLNSARQLTQQPAWVRVGYGSTYYPYDRSRRRSDFTHEAGKLGPLEKLDITDVVTDVSPGSTDQRQVMAVFEKDGKNFSFAIGSVKDGNYQIYSDDMLFIQDPHQLYKHWPPDIWEAIDKHEVKPGMNELQVDFAVGLGIPEGSGSSTTRTLDYSNGGKPLRITYSNGKATDIKTGIS